MRDEIIENDIYYSHMYSSPSSFYLSLYLYIGLTKLIAKIDGATRSIHRG